MIEYLKYRLDVFLKKQFDNTSRETIQKWIKGGLVKLNGQVQTSTKILVSSDDDIVVDKIPEQKITISPIKNNLKVYFQDEHIIVIEKTADLISHPAPSIPKDKHTLVNYVLFHSKKLADTAGNNRPGVVHRLDKDTSGVMVFAKSNEAYYSLIKMFEKHKMRREYKAVVWNWITEDQIYKDPLGPDPNDFRKRTVRIDGVKAETIVQPVKVFGKERISLVNCTLHTGRTHQIRVHLAYHGFPVVGDPVYGSDQRYLKNVNDNDLLKIAVKDNSRQLLHAHTLGFKHPITKEEMLFHSDIPQEFYDILDKCEDV
ncbi:MAG: RluA family pseudouridine synthase [Alphaproteobacteria bacterium]|nr:RluA family pseudouridine synthase [Alphaproteobacteria bacterium]MBL0718243.1 RluA family pseudouridine synthase [Alphaproteobacteria bacterium]